MQYYMCNSAYWPTVNQPWTEFLIHMCVSERMRFIYVYQRCKETFHYKKVQGDEKDAI